MNLTIDTDIPAGNGIIECIEGNQIQLRPDLRDTQGHWFYWHVRIRGGAGRTLQFHFPKNPCLTSHAVGMSLDGGLSWQWAGRLMENDEAFELDLPDDANDVRVSMAMPYTAQHLNTWLQKLSSSVTMDTLCVSRQQRDVPYLQLGENRSPDYCLLVCARHHACEMMASYVVEGLVEQAVRQLADQALSQVSKNIVWHVVPFVDYDGVLAGDQGKQRQPHDHNRDYSVGLYPETKAIRQLVEGRDDTSWICLDLHCPFIRGGLHNEKIYQVGSALPAMWEKQRQFAGILENHVRGELPYHADNDLPHGEDWNTAALESIDSFGQWMSSNTKVALATTLEIPYALAQETVVTPDLLRWFGGELADAVKTYWETQMPAAQNLRD